MARITEEQVVAAIDRFEDFCCIHSEEEEDEASAATLVYFTQYLKFDGEGLGALAEYVSSDPELSAQGPVAKMMLYAGVMLGVTIALEAEGSESLPRVPDAPPEGL